MNEGEIDWQRRSFSSGIEIKKDFRLICGKLNTPMNRRSTNTM